VSRTLIIFGIVLIATGLLWPLIAKLGLGRLPGDIVIERAFVRAHPWAREVGVVLNFEARGTGGQTAMFETSERSADLVEAYGRAASRPVASSVMTPLPAT